MKHKTPRINYKRLEKRLYQVMLDECLGLILYRAVKAAMEKAKELGNSYKYK
jgi:hypothetical protein